MNFGSIGGTNSIQYLVDQYMAIESRPKNKLVQQQKALEKKKDVFSELDSKLSALQSKMEYFTDAVSLPFQAKTAQSSDEDKVSVRVQNSATKGNHTLTVQQLAHSDTRVSNQFSNSGTDFSSFTSDQTFTIQVGHPTDSDPNNRVDISVTVSADTFSKTNDEVLQDIADAINDAMASAAADGTITSDEMAQASIITEQNGVSRLVLTSGQTGYTNRLSFGSSTLLDTLNINNNAQTSGTTGGYVYNVGTSATDSALNSAFVLDGMTMYRDSNTIDDAYDGITFQLKDTFSQEVTVSIDTDTESIKKDIQDFIDKYNDVIDYLTKNARINSDTYEKGPLQDDTIYASMISDLRGMVSESVDTAASDSYKLLYSIGIEADQSGKLSIKDESKLTDALETNPSYVSDLFVSDDGIANKLDDYIDRFVKVGGSIDSSKELLDEQIKNLDDRISYMNELLDKKEKQYFEEFTKMQKTMYTLQNQQAFFSQFLNMGGNS